MLARGVFYVVEFTRSGNELLKRLDGEADLRQCLETLRTCGHSCIVDGLEGQGLTVNEPKWYVEPELVLPIQNELQKYGVSHPLKEQKNLLKGKNIMYLDQLRCRHAIASYKYYHLVSKAIAAPPRKHKITITFMDRCACRFAEDIETSPSMSRQSSFHSLSSTSSNFWEALL